MFNKCQFPQSVMPKKKQKKRLSQTLGSAEGKNNKFHVLRIKSESRQKNILGMILPVLGSRNSVSPSDGVTKCNLCHAPLALFSWKPLD